MQVLYEFLKNYKKKNVLLSPSSLRVLPNKEEEENAAKKQ